MSFLFLSMFKEFTAYYLNFNALLIVHFCITFCITIVFGPFTTVVKKNGNKFFQNIFIFKVSVSTQYFVIKVEI